MKYAFALMFSLASFGLSAADESQPILSVRYHENRVSPQLPAGFSGEAPRMNLLEKENCTARLKDSQQIQLNGDCAYLLGDLRLQRDQNTFTIRTVQRFAVTRTAHSHALLVEAPTRTLIINSN